MSRMPLHPCLADPEAEAHLARFGWAVVDDLLDPEDLANLLAVIDEVYVDQRVGFHASNMSGAHEYRRAVDARVRPVVAAAVERRGLLVDHEPFTASLLVKWPSADSAFHTHQDWTMVDEDRFRTVNVWCPLVDTDDENGAFAALPGSHEVLRAIRCSPMPPQHYRSAGWDVSHDDMVKIPVRVGQALVFDHALLHASPPNRTDAWRPAVAAAFKPRAASLRHYYLTEPDGEDLEVFAVDSPFFTDFDIGDRPAYDVIDRVRFEPDGLDRVGLLRACGVPVADPPELEPEPEPRPVEAAAEVEPPQGGPVADHVVAPPRRYTPYERAQLLGRRVKRRLGR